MKKLTNADLPYRGTELTDALMLAQLESDSINTMVEAVLASFVKEG